MNTFLPPADGFPTAGGGATGGTGGTFGFVAGTAGWASAWKPGEGRLELIKRIYVNYGGWK